MIANLNFLTLSLSHRRLFRPPFAVPQCARHQSTNKANDCPQTPTTQPFLRLVAEVRESHQTEQERAQEKERR